MTTLHFHKHESSPATANPLIECVNCADYADTKLNQGITDEIHRKPRATN